MPQNPTIPLKIAAPNPGLTDVLNAHKIDIMQQLNCHAIATITAVSIIPSNNIVTVDATVNYNRTYFNRQPDGTYQAQTVNYPQLVDCPLMTMSGGGTYLSMPVKPGDQCMILFNDRDMSAWQTQAKGFTGPVPTARLHAFTDAVAVVGFPQITGTYSPDHALLTNGNAEVGVPQTGGLVRIANENTTLGTVLSTFFNSVSVATSIMEINTAAALANISLIGLLE